jgi:hypothetical protein
MKPEIQKEIFKKFPKIFRQKDESMKVTCMCWGLECESGWSALIFDLCLKIQTYLDSHPEVEQVEATQVKEKFGSLRFYVQGGDDNTEEMIGKAEAQSYKICEACSSTEKVFQTKGWIRTTCKACEEKRT